MDPFKDKEHQCLSDISVQARENPRESDVPKKHRNPGPRYVKLADPMYVGWHRVGKSALAQLVAVAPSDGPHV